MYKDCTGSQLLGAVKHIYFILQSVAWFGAWEFWFLWEHQSLWGMLFPWLFAVALERCELCRLWGHRGCAGIRPVSFLSCAERENLMPFCGWWHWLEHERYYAAQVMYHQQELIYWLRKWFDFFENLFDINVSSFVAFSPISLDLFTWCRTTLSSCSIRVSSYRDQPEGH